MRAPGDVELIFLGTGTSSGIPAIGCTCAVCTSADPRDQRLRTSAALRFLDAQGRERVVLIDCGPDLRTQAIRAGLTRCDAILITHNHVDHVWGLDEVRRFNVLMNGPVDLYAEPWVVQRLGEVYQHIFEPERNVQESFVARVIPHRISPGEPFELFGLRVTAIRLLHGRLPVLGFRVDRAGLLAGSVGRASAGGGGESLARDGLLPMAWCTDVSSVPPESWRRLEGLQTLCLDGLRHRHHPTHLTVGQAVSVARRVRPARTWLIHIAHELGHAVTDGELAEVGPNLVSPSVGEPDPVAAGGVEEADGISDGSVWVRLAYDGLVVRSAGGAVGAVGGQVDEGTGPAETRAG